MTYRAGPAVAELATAADPSSGLAAARLFLVERWSTRCGRPRASPSHDGDGGQLYLDHVDAALQVQIRDWAAPASPCTWSPPGWSCWPIARPEEVAAYLSRPLEAFTARTVTAPAAIRRRLGDPGGGLRVDGRGAPRRR
mgnify:CR=1 FL=1